MLDALQDICYENRRNIQATRGYVLLVAAFLGLLVAIADHRRKELYGV